MPGPLSSDVQGVVVLWRGPNRAALVRILWQVRRAAPQWLAPARGVSNNERMVTIVKQVTVFLTDKPGQLANAEAALADAGINIRALSSIPLASDHGIAHFVVDDAPAAEKALGPVGLAVRTTDVLLVEMPDRPRALLEVTQRLADAGVNIQYVYGSVAAPGAPAPAVFKVSDIDAGAKALEGI